MKRLLRSSAVLAIITLISVLPDATSAQGLKQLSISGQIRQRTEYSGKDFNSNKDNFWFHLLRTRINVLANPAEDVTAMVQFQDSRTFGEETSTLGDGSADLLDVHQAYFQVNNLFDSGFNVRMGRQEINVGNERLVGAVGWDNVGRSFDGALVSYQGEKASLRLLAAKLVSMPGVPDSQNLYGIIASYPFTEGGTIEALVLLDNDSREINGERKQSRITAGAAATGKKKRFDYELEAYLQTGKAFETGMAERSAISAYLLSGKVGYIVSKERKVRLGGLFTILSGDNNRSDGEISNFNTLFATNHKFYGFMDFFLNFGKRKTGIVDTALSLAFNASDPFRISVDAHNFMAAEVLSGADDQLGIEVDVTGKYSYNSAFSFVLGLSIFDPGDAMGVGLDTGVWGYLMTIVNL